MSGFFFSCWALSYFFQYGRLLEFSFFSMIIFMSGSSDCAFWRASQKQWSKFIKKTEYAWIFLYRPYFISAFTQCTHFSDQNHRRASVRFSSCVKNFYIIKLETLYPAVNWPSRIYQILQTVAHFHPSSFKNLS